MRDSILAELRATILAEMTTCVTAALAERDERIRLLEAELQQLRNNAK
jgi:hypothetical protein